MQRRTLSVPFCRHFAIWRQLVGHNVLQRNKDCPVDFSCQRSAVRNGDKAFWAIDQVVEGGVLVYMEVYVVEHQAYLERACKVTKLVQLGLVACLGRDAACRRKATNWTRLAQRQLQRLEGRRAASCKPRLLRLGQVFRRRAKERRTRYELVSIIYKDDLLLIYEIVHMYEEGKEDRCLVTSFRELD